MNYQDYKSKMIDCYKVNRMKLTALVIVVQLLNGGISYVNAILSQSKDSVAPLMVSLVTFLILLVTNFALLFLFLKTLRGEKFELDDLKYAFKRFPIELGFTVIMSLLSTVILMILVMVFGSIPILYILTTFIVQVLQIILQSLFAYAIHDGCKGVMPTLTMCFTVLYRHVKVLFRAVLPYILFSFSISLIMQLLVQTNIKDIETIPEAISTAFDKNMISLAWQLLGLYLLNYIGSSFFLAYSYLFYAQVYQEELDLFPGANAQLEGTITIDVM